MKNLNQSQVEELKKEIQKEFLFDRTQNLILALTSINYYGNEDLRKYCIKYSKDIIACQLSGIN